MMPVGKTQLSRDTGADFPRGLWRIPDSVKSVRS